MKKFLTLAALTTATLFATEGPKVGIVNFTTCVTESKLGKQEQASFESMKKQMTALIEDSEKQLREISEKFQDKDFLDGLSAEAEEELKTKFRTLSEELNRYQQQYYQVVQQANYKLVQTMSSNINNAAERIAGAKGLNMVINKDACFYFISSLDITNDVISEMDKSFNGDLVKKVDNGDEGIVKQADDDEGIVRQDDTPAPKKADGDDGVIKEDKDVVPYEQAKNDAPVKKTSAKPIVKAKKKK